VDGFSAAWTGLVQAPTSETYTLYTTADDGVRVWFNDMLVIDGWKDQGPTEYSANVAFVTGQRYDLRVEYYENGGGAQASLSWSSPSTPKQLIPTSALLTTVSTGAGGVVGTGTGVQATYYDQMTLTGNTVTRVDATIAFNWGNGSPDPKIPVDKFSAAWTGKLLAPKTETYTIYAKADDGVRVYLGGTPIIDAWVDEGPTEYSAPVNLTAGQFYDLRVEYFEDAGGATCTVSWSSPTTTKTVIPQSQLYPSGP
jgi:hypothetical protein